MAGHDERTVQSVQISHEFDKYMALLFGGGFCFVVPPCKGRTSQGSDLQKGQVGFFGETELARSAVGKEAGVFVKNMLQCFAKHVNVKTLMNKKRSSI